MTQTTSLRIAIAQVNFTVGDIEFNTDQVIAIASDARDRLQADVILFPELTLTAYPPEDLLLRPGLYIRLHAAFEKIKNTVHGIKLIIGYPEKAGEGLYNSAATIENGQRIANYRKQCLPNYGVFDEKRYFTPGERPCVIDINGIPTAITICEDVWFPEPTAQAKAAGAHLMLCMNASPFDMRKSTDRQSILRARAQENQMPIVYAHWNSGHDEIVFDGGSLVVNANGDVCKKLPYFSECVDVIEVHYDGNEVTVPTSTLPEPLSEEAIVYQALVLGVRDYIRKNKFNGALVATSGGIDSALTLAVAVDAIGKDNVEACLLPSEFTSDLSIQCATEEAEALGIQLHTISIDDAYQTFLNTLKTEHDMTPTGHVCENLQARCRGVIMMALSNQSHKLVLTTGNKSEMAVGYATLYGDMVGGFCVLKDVSKTMVYRLAAYRNQISPVIPQAVIEREPTAELAHGQRDQDTLPPYETLDKILQLYVEEDESVETIVTKGFGENIVRQIVCLVDRNEYKRRQAPPGVRITPRAFGRDRRYPITSGFWDTYQGDKKQTEDTDTTT